MPNAVVPINKIKAVTVMVAKKVRLEIIYQYTDKRESARIKFDKRSVLAITGKHPGRTELHVMSESVKLHYTDFYAEGRLSV